MTAVHVNKYTDNDAQGRQRVYFDGNDEYRARTYGGPAAALPPVPAITAGTHLAAKQQFCQPALTHAAR